MANVVSKSSPEEGVLRSVNTPDYPAASWFINPVLPAGPSKYWKNNAGSLEEMTQAEKDVVDAASASAQTAGEEASLKLSLFPQIAISITTSVAGLVITTDAGTIISNDQHTVTADPSDQKYIRTCLVYDETADIFFISAQEKTTQEYGTMDLDEYVVTKIKEWSVVANGTSLVEEQSWL